MSHTRQDKPGSRRNRKVQTISTDEKGDRDRKGIDKSTRSWLIRVAYVIASMSAMSPSSRVLSAVAADPTRIIYASPNPGHSVAGSVMSSPSRCVEGIVARSIAVARKPRGGGRWE